jgi:molecular chaperone HscB
VLGVRRHGASPTLLCAHCGKVQPIQGADYFQVFGLERKLGLDTAALEQEFHRFSRRLHPDRFARATQEEQNWSLASTALLNDAYRTLRDPIQRTEYLLRLEGLKIGEENAGKNKSADRQPPADLLEEVFELNMQLEEMRMNQKMGEDDPALVSGPDRRQPALRRACLRKSIATWPRKAHEWDAGDAATREKGGQRDGRAAGSPPLSAQSGSRRQRSALNHNLRNQVPGSNA